MKLTRQQMVTKLMRVCLLYNNISLFLETNAEPLKIVIYLQTKHLKIPSYTAEVCYLNFTKIIFLLPSCPPLFKNSLASHLFTSIYQIAKNNIFTISERHNNFNNIKTLRWTSLTKDWRCKHEWREGKKNLCGTNVL